MATKDSFTAARQLFNRRKALHDKANQLMAEASADVQALCEAAEEQATRERIAERPSSPDTSD